MDGIQFPCQTVDFCRYHVINIRKAYGLAVILINLRTFLGHPVMRHIFANTVGLISKPDLAVCRKEAKEGTFKNRGSCKMIDLIAKHTKLLSSALNK